MDSCYVPNNPAYTDCWRPLSPTCGQAPVLTPLRPLAAPSPPVHPPPAYPPARSPLPPSSHAPDFTPARTPPDASESSMYTSTTPPTHSTSVATTMGAFPPLFDLEPLPNFVTLSPHAPYNKEASGMLGKEKGDHMADVLLSLKHAVVHPHQTLPSMMGGMSTGGCYTSGGYQDATYGSSAPPHMFPAMSVNVSMNMTMGVSNVNMGYSPDPSLQHQWPASCAGQQVTSVSPISGMGYPQPSAPGIVSPLPVPYSGSCSQGYSVGSYSWAGDLRSDHPPMPSLDRDICLRSPPLRPRPGSPGVPYPNSTPPGGQLSPTLSALRRRPSSVGMSGITSSLDVTKPMMSDGLKPNLCRICGKTYARPSTLKTHLRTHSGEKPYRCNECNKSFSQAANLTAHVRTHSGEKPFRCPICDRRFSQSSSVTTHMRTHSGERPYRCRMCKKAFSDSSTLTKHLRIHSGEKPYQCKLCLLRFSQSGNLNRHMRVHSQTS
ncbi:protein glass-like isoform X1 [Penaeus japonicus]|uniref:protein glass-like n=1 Tax=Penaeus japonicus TaxID=27405 RepID=UPI001C70C565|nr:protein glass-like [Penaeus japonicus]XP_042867753.1 protein glass-like [Penaeus japonicus]XP_042891386.1 protein glass-like isoform X1 [Penaeus japonicus]XP_042891387.1 protein glass-like isoform X1 [Penaeus japonicus]